MGEVPMGFDFREISELRSIKCNEAPPMALFAPTDLLDAFRGLNSQQKADGKNASTAVNTF